LEDFLETLLTIAELAEKTKFSEAKIRKHILNRTIPFYKVGAAIRFLPSEIEGWVKAGCKFHAAKNDKEGRG
jgi:excisionase family DNA binding protein